MSKLWDRFLGRDIKRASQPKADKKTPQKGARSEYPIAPIIEDPPDRKIGSIYRRPDDPPNVIRLQGAQPKGFSKKIYSWEPVAGISFYRANVDQFLRGSAWSIALTPEPDNPKDPGAIAVIGSWSNSAGAHSAPLGYLPAKTAAALATLDPPHYAGRIETLFTPLDKKAAGLRLSIWAKRGATLSA